MGYALTQCKFMHIRLYPSHGNNGSMQLYPITQALHAFAIHEFSKFFHLAQQLYYSMGKINNG